MPFYRLGSIDEGLLVRLNLDYPLRGLSILARLYESINSTRRLPLLFSFSNYTSRSILIGLVDGVYSYYSSSIYYYYYY